MNSGVQTELQGIDFEERHRVLHLILKEAVNAVRNLQEALKKKTANFLATRISRPRISNPRPATLYHEARGHVCKLCISYKISQ